jgi:hypothetical protein
MSTHVAAQPPKRVQKLFAGGGVGNETSGILHVDARGWKARFITSVAASNSRAGTGTDDRDR